MSELGTQHPVVRAYLRQFDVAAAAVPAARRRALREEIAGHLRELVAPDADEQSARLVLLEFGSPEEIVAHEVGEPPRRRRGRWLIPAVAGLMIAAVVAVAIGLYRPADTNVVTAHPAGPERVSEGRAFEEYRAVADELPSLPAGASWPTGVPEGLDVGITADGEALMEAGAGANIAQFTYACAWEYEYLDAEAVSDDARLVAALSALTEWSTSGFRATSDPGGGWAETVLTPLLTDNHDGLYADVTAMCSQALITDVWKRVDALS